jgi:hypothetical protein
MIGVGRYWGAWLTAVVAVVAVAFWGAVPAQAAQGSSGKASNTSAVTPGIVYNQAATVRPTVRQWRTATSSRRPAPGSR